MSTKTCETDGCDRPSRRLGLCARHRNELTLEQADARRAERAPVAALEPQRLNQSRVGRVCEAGCGRPVHARGFCHSHYKTFAPRKPCSTEGCSGKRHAQGLCSLCYSRAFSAGLLSVVRPVGRDIDERFDSNVVERGDCRVWTGTLDHTGRGRFTPEGGVATQAHRYSYRRAHGELPVDGNGKNLPLDHRCRVPSCVRPEHLEPVTSAENTRRALVASGHRNITAEDTGWFFTALRAFVGGGNNFPTRVSTLHSRVTVWQVAA